VDIVIFASSYVGKLFLEQVIPFHLKGMVNIKAVVVCDNSKNPFYIEGQEDVVVPYCQENSLNVLHSPDELTGTFDFGLSLSNFFILKKKHIELFTKGIVNFHGAPVLWHRGSAAPSFHILGNDTAQWGFTYHLIHEKLDLGDIIEQVIYDIPKGLSAYEIDATVLNKAVEHFPIFFEKLLLGDYQLISQQALNNVPSNKRSDLYGGELVDLHLDDEQLLKLIRAYDWSKILEHVRIKVCNQNVRLVPEKTYQELLSSYRKQQ
jgi:methionyl-tRNA formyltransferase